MKSSTVFRLRSAAAFALMLAFTACASTQLRSSWKDPSYSFAGMRKVLVMGIGGQESVQRTLEDAFAKNLAAKGAQGIPSYTLSPASNKLDEAGWKRLITENGITVVMVSRLVDTKTVEREVPPTTTTVPVGGAAMPISNNGGFIGGNAGGTYMNSAGTYNNNWYGYYQANYQVMSTPGYTIKDQYAVIDTKVFDVASGKMVWTANSDTIMGQSIDNNALAAQFARIVTEAMYKP